MEYILHFKKKPSTPSSLVFLCFYWLNSGFNDGRHPWSPAEQCGGDQKKKQKGETREKWMRGLSIPWVGFSLEFLWRLKKKGGDIVTWVATHTKPRGPFFPRHGVKMKSVTLSHEWHSRMSDKTTAVGYQKKSKRNDPSAHTWRYDMSCESYPASLLTTCTHHGSSPWSPVPWQSVRHGRLDRWTTGSITLAALA